QREHSVCSIPGAAYIARLIAAQNRHRQRSLVRAADDSNGKRPGFGSRDGSASARGRLNHAHRKRLRDSARQQENGALQRNHPLPPSWAGFQTKRYPKGSRNAFQLFLRKGAEKFSPAAGPWKGSAKPWNYLNPIHTGGASNV